jgi:hypothetical protein
VPVVEAEGRKLICHCYAMPPFRLGKVAGMWYLSL